MIRPQGIAKFLIVAASCSLQACFMPKIFEQEAEYFDAQVRDNTAITYDYIEQSNFKLFFASAGALNKPVVVFIHGTPGSWRAGARYLTEPALLERARVVVLDRPGWGESKLSNTDVEHSFQKQAAMIAPLLKNLRQESGNQGIVLIGHSLGASLAPRIAMDYPEEVNAMLLLAGSLDPKLGSPRWYNRAASLAVVNWAIGSGMRRANAEIMALRTQLDAMSGCWDALRIPITVMQGQKDTLVSPHNIRFAARVMPSAKLKIIDLEEASHFLPWENRPRVVAETLELIDQLEAPPAQRFAASKCESQYPAG
ncbi:MAG: alpha/beta fold hydrolase [Pseudomonadales bacterium]